VTFQMIALLITVASASGASAQETGVPRAQFITVQTGEFNKIDADKNGQLTRKEIEDFQRLSAVAQSGARNRQLFAQLDTDRNGQLSPAEFLKFNPPANTANATPMLTRMDRNRDSQINLVEYRTATLANFDRLDVDKDGTVTPAEMKAGGITPTAR
jgi:Ca2+-binding EF-hand superfamily protein